MEQKKKKRIIIISIIALLILSFVWEYDYPGDRYHRRGFIIYTKSAASPFVTYHRVKGANFLTFRTIPGTCMAKDNSSLFVGDFKPVSLAGLDVKSFETIFGPYAKDKNNVYYLGDTSCSLKLVSSMPDEFVALVPNASIGLASGWAGDGVNAYYHGNLISGLDPNTFVRIDENYVKDKNLVYKNIGGGFFEKIDGANPNTFQP